MLKALILVVMIANAVIKPALAQIFFANPLAHTYSIVARDPVTGEIGVAVQSHWFSVGSLVSWAEAGTGAIATQSFVNPAFGPRGLELLRSGKTAQETLDVLIAADESRSVRQLAVIDAKGNTAAYTGAGCIAEAGHIAEKNFSVQANLMLYPTVWSEMAAAFRQAKGPLAERMIEALEAAQAAGGDIRGMQSAALLVVAPVSTGKIWEDRKIDLQVADHAEPVTELKKLLQMHRAYEYMNAGDVAVEKGDMESAMKAYSKAEMMLPGNPEMKFWHAVTLVNNGLAEKALPLFKEVFAADKNWVMLIGRLRKAGQLNCGDDTEQLILKQQ